jgi:thiosulfate dehydrogenase [quinone] large subunit
MSAPTRTRTVLPRRPAPSARLLDLHADWAAQPWPSRILRAFLGGTFVYAGAQKFLDRNFLHAGTPDYIGDQLRAFAPGSPIGPILLGLAHVAVPVGIAIALVEIALGLGTLLGIAPIAWAATGCAINVMLFLSATWHVHPYFLGSDSIYAVAWAAYLVGLVELRRQRPLQPVDRRRRAIEAQDLSRRRFLRGIAIGSGALVIGIAGSLLSGRPSQAAAILTSPGTTKPPKERHGGGGGNGNRGSGPGATEPPTPSGTPIAKLDSIPVGGAVPFDDPSQGPSILCRLSTDGVAAYSRVCTHAGCLVEFDRGSGVLFCPCHGAEFDPKHGARVVAGPAPTPLPSVAVRIDPATGEVLATN